GALLQSLHTNIYWKASITSGAPNFTNTLIQLNDSIKGADAIAASATVNGTYDIVGGLTITSTATSLTSTAPEATTLPGFFVMANKAAPVLSNVLITPAGNQCANVVRTVTATVTPGGGAITSVVLNYNINGTPQTPVTMTNVSGNDWSGVIPTVTPVNATVTWNIVATDANLLVGTAIGTPYNDEPNFGFTVTASASETTVCSNSPVELSMAASNSSSTPTYTAPPAVSNPTTDEDFGNITITQGATTILNNTSTRNTLDGTIGIPTGTAGSYSNYTAFGPYSLTAGQTYNFSASTLQGFNAYDNAIGIYIDYNRDGDFADAGENVYVSAATTSGAHTETGSFLVPASVSSGVTRMRILVNEGLVTGPTMS
ncbi:MAG TPA: GEVED domain-containing protein, partial [Bacteroidia bacterium]|nr:GEVED domain-containing protein [Bacteroidia bacterium]